VAAAFVLALAAALIIGALSGLVGRLRQLAGGRLQSSITEALNKTVMVGVATGAILTAIVQSSSLTLSVLVPFAGTGIVTLEQAFPIMLGANFGTTLTALFAAAAVPGEALQQAVQIALVHMLFNTAGVFIIYPLRTIRQIPLRLARWIGSVAVESKLEAAAYVVLLFYGAPGLGLLVWHFVQGGAS
jgi:sodium-dependent phosphate cotransporter